MALANSFRCRPLGMIDHERHLIIQRSALVRDGLFPRLDLDHLGDQVAVPILVLDDEVRDVVADFFF